MPTNPPFLVLSKVRLLLRCLVRAALTLAGFASSIDTTCFAGDELDDKTRPISFVEDVQPILKAACIKCHGPLRQEGEYRLDVREVALTGGANYAPNIIPNNAADSPLMHFVTGQVDDMLMPAKGNRLTAQQIDILRAWIDQGAIWPDSANNQEDAKGDWWSLRPLTHADVPHHASAHHPIDAFVRSKLEEHALSPAPRAEKATLVRRVYFDLLGLPPTPEEVVAFVTDDNPDAYERLVDRLLAAPRYGERWARHWMDAAHFAETHGHDQDRIRENAWPYRDYLIAAFNDDTPFKQFVHEQIAADVLASDDPQKIAALGFLAAGPWDESTLRDIREDTIDREIGRYVDRDDMLTNVMSNFTSLTVHCARCHDHKFDPISQADYYGLQAVFAGVERANRSYDVNAAIRTTRQALRLRADHLASPNAAIKEELLQAAAQKSVAAWERDSAGRVLTWRSLSNATAASTDGSTLTAQPDGSFLASGTRPERDTYTIAGLATDSTITGIRVEVLADPSLPMSGPGRQDNGNLHLSEIEVLLGEDTLIPIARAISDFDQADWGVAKAIDGNPDTAWGIHPNVGVGHEAIFEFTAPVQLRGQQKITVRLKQLHGRGHLIGRPKITYSTDTPPLSVNHLPADIAEILAIEADSRSEEQRFQLALYVARERVASELAALPKPKLVYAAAAEFEPDGSLKPPPGPRPIHRLARGDIRSPKELVSPGALTCIEGLPAKFEVADGQHESTRRAALAKWLTDTRNPLLWRSIVNRIWQHHFGRGIVDTPNDFGRLGSKPIHPELLDWLAVDFRDSGQSLKTLHRKMLMSETYQQTSRAAECLQAGDRSVREDQAETLDTDNRLLWRMNRIRLDAECVRDAMLATSGQLDLRMGGPSDRQFDLKPGRHVTPVIDYGIFDLNGPAGQRRSVYRFLFRTLPDPFMEALDCPAGDQIMPSRTNSVTVQQVLAMWNDPLVLNQAEHLSKRLRAENPGSVQQVAWAVQLALGREATAVELERFVRYADEHGLENFCRLLFNTNEFMFID
ncbi:MAG: PSD1 and planctomycete cytochrome C domain-containing protein [Pirellulaceae bacterium]|nr:PSD1 and planctomycete cytochrome C domain-containing protein [Pirellulaceae bacterium]